MPADDTRLLSMLGEIAKGALCEDDLECPLSATVGRLLPPNAQDHDPHVEMLSNRCQGTRAGVEAKTQAKFEMQQQLQAELRDIQQRRGLQFQEGELIVERVRVARNQLNERLTYATKTQEALQKRFVKERDANIRLMDMLSTELQRLTAREAEFGKHAAVVSESQAGLVEEFREQTDMQAQLQAELQAERVAARRQSADVVRAFARGGVPASALSALEASSKGVGMLDVYTEEKAVNGPDAALQFDDLVTEKRAGETSTSDEVEHADFKSFSEQMAIALSRGYESVKVEIIEFMEQQESSPPIDEPSKSNFSPVETPKGDDEMERLVVEITVQKCEELFRVTSSSRCSILAGVAAAKLQVDCEVLALAREGAISEEADSDLWTQRAAWLQERVAGAEEEARLKTEVFKQQQCLNELGKQVRVEEENNVMLDNTSQEFKDVAERTGISFDHVNQEAVESQLPSSLKADLPKIAREGEDLWQHIRNQEDMHESNLRRLETLPQSIQDARGEMDTLRQSYKQLQDDEHRLEQEQAIIEDLRQELENKEAHLDEELDRTESGHDQLRKEIAVQLTELKAHRETVSSWNKELDYRSSLGCCKRRRQPAQQRFGGGAAPSAGGPKRRQPEPSQSSTKASGGASSSSSRSGQGPRGSNAPRQQDRPPAVLSRDGRASDRPVAQASPVVVPTAYSASRLASQDQDSLPRPPPPPPPEEPLNSDRADLGP